MLNIYNNIEQIPLDFSRVCVDMYQKTTEERFWEKVDKTDYCWNWTAAKRNGYGHFKFNGKTVRAHRFSYEIHKGKIPKGLTIDHLCRNHSCVNAAHLEAVTSKENTLRGYGVAGINSRKTHCIHEHPLSGSNLYVTPNKKRQCKICDINSSKKYHLLKSKLDEIKKELKK